MKLMARKRLIVTILIMALITFFAVPLTAFAKDAATQVHVKKTIYPISAITLVYKPGTPLENLTLSSTNGNNWTSEDYKEDVLKDLVKMIVTFQIPGGQLTQTYIYPDDFGPRGHGVTEPVEHSAEGAGGSGSINIWINKIDVPDVPTPKTTDITFNKLDSQLESPLSGAEFELRGIAPTTGIFTDVSDENGQVTFTGVPAGTYAIQEIDAPAGYHLENTVYKVVITENDGTLDVSFLDPSGEPVEGSFTVENDPILNDLTIEKVVKGSNAPENQEPAVEKVYDFVITFENGYWLTEEDVTSKGGIYFEPLQAPARIVNDQQTTSYRFGLADGGWFKIKVRDGVEYSLYELSVDGVATTYTVTGTQAGMDGDVLYGTMGEKDAAIIVQNHYGNDGLTVQKLVDGDLAPKDATFNFTAIFWTAENEEVMTESLMGEAQGEIDAANTALDAIELTGEQSGELQSARDGISAAAIALKAAEDDRDAKLIVLQNAQEALAAAQTSVSAITTIEGQIDSLNNDFTNLDTEDPEYATNAAIITDRITDLTAELAAIQALDLSALGNAVTTAQTSFDAAKDAVTAALNALNEAKAALDTLITSDSAIKAYVDAEKAVADAQAKYDDKDANKETHFLQRIWERIVNFFRGLVVGETYVAGVTDIVYSPTSAALSYDEATSKSAFSLKDGEEIVFNFDEYFSEHEGETIYFEIVETGDKGADVTVSSKGLGDSKTEGKVITGTITAETGNPIITYTNDFGDSEEPPKPPVVVPPGGGGGKVGGGGGGTTTITEDPIPAAPVPETMIEDQEIPAGPLPKTGGLDALLLYGLGALLAGGGAALKLKSKKNL